VYVLPVVILGKFRVTVCVTAHPLERLTIRADHRRNGSRALTTGRKTDDHRPIELQGMVCEKCDGGDRFVVTVFVPHPAP